MVDSGNGRPRVVLVSAPFGPLRTPSLALSILKSLATSCGWDAVVWYSTLRYASIVGSQFYDLIAEGAPSTTDLTGEWLFAVRTTPESDREYFERVLLSRQTARRIDQKSNEDKLLDLAARLKALRTGVPAFVSSEAQAILALRPTLVGFTTVFQQTMASIAIADVLKQMSPNVPIVLGGANCEEPMGSTLLAHHSSLDHVVSGEGEDDFVNLLASFGKKGRSLVSGSRSALEPTPTPPRFIALDDQPIPDYFDYFSQLEQDPRLDFEPRMPYEGSRGCWWGAKVHCTFCGLNGGTMEFRAKRPAKVLADLRTLIDRHGAVPVDFVDNILALEYFTTLLPQLVAEPLGVDLFFETKANLKPQQVQLLRESGVTRIQPGIESLSDNVLKLMGKGVRAIQNVYLLKMCAEHGIQPSWNWLWGFPGESPDEYGAMADLVPQLEHLEPPTVGSAIRLDRYSPLFERSESFKLRAVRPYPAYQFVYRDYDDTDLSRVAYYFTFDYEQPTEVAAYTLALAQVISEWQLHFAASTLVSAIVAERLWLWDTRSCATRALSVLAGVERAVYEACATPESIGAVLAACSQYSATEVASALARLIAARFVLQIDQRVLALGLPLETCTLAAPKLEALVGVMRRTADTSDAEALTFAVDRHVF